MDRGAWQATVDRVAESNMTEQPSLHTHTHTHQLPSTLYHEIRKKIVKRRSTSMSHLYVLLKDKKEGVSVIQTEQNIQFIISKLDFLILFAKAELQLSWPYFKGLKEPIHFNNDLLRIQEENLKFPKIH